MTSTRHFLTSTSRRSSKSLRRTSRFEKYSTGKLETGLVGPGFYIILMHSFISPLFKSRERLREALINAGSQILSGRTSCVHNLLKNLARACYQEISTPRQKSSPRMSHHLQGRPIAGETNEILQGVENNSKSNKFFRCCQLLNLVYLGEWYGILVLHTEIYPSGRHEGLG